MSTCLWCPHCELPMWDHLELDRHLRYGCTVLQIKRGEALAWDALAEIANKREVVR